MLTWEFLTLVWTAITAFAVVMYVLMDGFDLGVGILFPFAATDEDRDAMMNTVAPIWDFNETWLILGGAALFAAFPLAYAVLMPALYLPVLMMLAGLIFRGVAFEFRFKARRSRHLWDWSFFLGSSVATFAQGLILGAFIQGIAVEGRAFAGSPFDWLTPFSLLVGVSLLAGYALLGSTWLVLKTEGALQSWCYGLARTFLIAVLVGVAAVSLWTPIAHADIRERWFEWPNIAFLSPVPLLTAGLAFALWRALERRYEGWPFVLSMLLFLLSFGGLAISLWPYIVPRALTIWDAASPPESQIFLLIGMVFLIPTVLAYTVYCYYVFRGKVRAGYH